jgi:hypothetical protein
MPLTINALPSQVPPSQFAAPFDAQTSFMTTPTAFTATGFVGSVTLDLGGVVNLPSGVGSGAGRTAGLWCVNITAIDFAQADESYKLALLGSNDAAFGNGNVDMLAFRDFAAASAGRQIPTLLGPSLAVAPFTEFIPFVNLRQARLIYRYARLHLTVGGTTPSITLLSWLSLGAEQL